jgi:hypothetical protein
MTDKSGRRQLARIAIAKAGTSSHLLPLGLLFVLANGSLPGAAVQARDLDEQRAFQRAVQILQGNPYGQTFTEVARVIKRATFSRSGQSLCGKSKGPVWIFWIQTEPLESNSGQRIEGDLVIDARTGRIECAGLPFLD